MMKTHLILLTSFVLGLAGTAINQARLMLILLCIESMILTMFLSTTTLTLNDPHTATTPIIILTIGACEAGVGLTILKISSNNNSSDLTKTMTLLQC
uniref:NADH-ubiquinone oxidoreductase chain 4L n=1 Tax=Pseudocalotes microlepis TaxID=1963763 RepID=A0A384TN98_9SAUR|nr:NADH dehydrogenase subunit 4L [Pseudocalotes microlepis]AQU64362.1 NADH dehydrogenase subunit 4L [Pseudocalotes microlepis]QGN67005.1 NADH dehydrogenase subunit 4L [Pseudocalotes microlepis]